MQQQQTWAICILVALAGFVGGYVSGKHADLAGTAAVPMGSATVSCFFSPQGGCTDAMVSEIDAAAKSVELQGYSFTSHVIGDALIAAHRRGVDVRVVLDAKETRDNPHEAQYIREGGVAVYVDGRHAIAHSKIVLVDSRTVITGSFNFTHAAEQQNAENILILHDQPAIQSAYEQNFRRHLSHSERF